MPTGLPSRRRLRAGGAGRRCRGHPRGRLAVRHARADRPPPRRAARLRRALRLRGRPGVGDARPGVRARRVRRRGDGRRVPGRRGRHRLGRRPTAARATSCAPTRTRLVAVVEGTEMEPESLVSVPLDRRRPRRRRAERLPDRHRQAVHRRRGRAGRALRHDGGARVRLRAPARHAARAGAHRRAHRAAQPPRLPRAAAARRSRARSRARPPAQRRRPRPRPLQGRQRRLRARRGRQGADRRRRRGCAPPCARTTSSPGSAARSSR